jgi:hypothetical protein
MTYAPPMKHAAFAIALSLAVSAGPVRAYDAGIPAQGLPSAAEYAATVLPDRAGVVSWRTLAKVETVPVKGRMVPKFDPQISELDRTTVRVQGFMLPMDLGDQQHHFLISAVPPHCPFCLPAGPDAVMEVKAKNAIAFSLEPVLLTGKFVVVKDDSYGLLYQLLDADAIRER